MPELVELPSGNVARLLRPQLSVMLKRGQIPNPLLPAAVASMDGGVEDAKAALELVDFLVAAAFVEPKVTVDQDAGEGELSVDALSEADKAFVVKWTQRGVAALATFREERAGTGGGDDGGAVLDEA